MAEPKYRSTEEASIIDAAIGKAKRLPEIVAGSGNKVLSVKADLTGYEISGGEFGKYIATYSNEVSYLANVSTVLGSDGILYKCLINNGPPSPVNPVGDTTGTWTSMTPVVSGGVPVGAYQLWPFPSAPEGWLLANGTTFQRAEYPELVAAITAGGMWDSGLFGSGDGSTTFKVKAVQDYFLQVHGTTDDPTRLLGSLKGQQVPEHNHTFGTGESVVVGSGCPGAAPAQTGGGACNVYPTTSYGSGTILAPKSICFNLIVKYE